MALDYTKLYSAKLKAYDPVRSFCYAGLDDPTTSLDNPMKHIPQLPYADGGVINPDNTQWYAYCTADPKPGFSCAGNYCPPNMAYWCGTKNANNRYNMFQDTWCQGEKWQTTQPGAEQMKQICSGEYLNHPDCISWCQQATGDYACDDQIRDYCSRIDNAVDKEICACFMPTAFYDKMAEQVANKFNAPSLLFNGNPYCSYPKCAQSKVWTLNQKMFNPKCPDINISSCVNNFTVNNDGTINGNITPNQGNTCSLNVNPTPEPNPEPTPEPEPTPNPEPNPEPEPTPEPEPNPEPNPNPNPPTPPTPPNPNPTPNPNPSPTPSDKSTTTTAIIIAASVSGIVVLALIAAYIRHKYKD